MSERLFVRLHEDATQGPESEAPAGTLRTLAFDPSLRPHVTHVLAYREDIAAGCDVVERVLPDGALRLVFNLGASVSSDQTPAAILIGAHTSPVTLRLRGAIDGLSVTLGPGAAQALFGLPAGEIARHHRAAGVALAWRCAAAARTADAHRGRRVAHARAAGRAAAAAAGADATALALVNRATALLRGSEATTRSVRDVAAAVGVGERRLQQLFHAHVGLSPRTFGRLARLHGMLRVLRRQAARPAWAALAADGGYYDQAHLANEFRVLCGVTPAEFMRRTISPSSKTAA